MWHTVATQLPQGTFPYHRDKKGHVWKFTRTRKTYLSDGMWKYVDQYDCKTRNARSKFLNTRHESEWD